MQHCQTNKVAGGLLTSLPAYEELTEGSVPCENGSKAGSTEVNSVGSEDIPSNLNEVKSNG